LAEDAPREGSVEVFRADVLAGVRHGFLGRSGGVSQGEVSGLNVGLGSGDDPRHIVENRRRAVAAVAAGAALATVYQVHSAACASVVEPWPDDQRPLADALVTDRPGVVLGILTADCAPVLFADFEAGVIGAAHAGWKGAVGGVTDATISAMERLGADRSRIAAAVGPCIAQTSYEVDAGFRDRFCKQDQVNAAYFVAGTPDHWQFDLEGYVADRLAAAGLTRVGKLGLDTYAAPQRFFSYRRACHRAEAAYGRQMSLISLA
jgi:YfiH family protein